MSLKTKVLSLTNYDVNMHNLTGISDVNDSDQSTLLILQIILFLFFLNIFHLFHLQSHIDAKNMPIDIILENFKNMFTLTCSTDVLI